VSRSPDFVDVGVATEIPSASSKAVPLGRPCCGQRVRAMRVENSDQDGYMSAVERSRLPQNVEATSRRPFSGPRARRSRRRPGYQAVFITIRPLE